MNLLIVYVVFDKYSEKKKYDIAIIGMFFPSGLSFIALIAFTAS